MHPLNIPQSSIPKLIKSIVIIIILHAASNALTVFLNAQLNFFLVSPQNQESIQKVQSDSLILYTANLSPFPIVVTLVILYFLPIIQSIHQKKFNMIAITRIINIPIVLSFYSLLGWLIGISIFQFLMFYRGYTLDLATALESIPLSLSMVIVSFVLGYYLLDFYHRKAFIPLIFQESDFNTYPNGIRVPLSKKFFIYLLTISFLPGLITYRLIMILNNKGQNAFGKDIRIEVGILFFIMSLIIITITILLIQSIRSNLLQMNQQVQSIEEGDFYKSILVTSRDELGNLATAINFMTKSLAEKELIKDSFGKIVSPRIRDILIKGNLKLGGEESEAVILFSDLENFTILSEILPPSEVVQILNQYFSLMESCISKNGGIINKFIGDGILAFFQRPFLMNSLSDAAVESALEMLENHKEINYLLNQKNLPNLNTRIGIHKGKVIAGNIGSSNRMEYTLIGDAVNTASRLENACKTLPVSLLISEQVFVSLQKENLKAYFQFAGELKLKGKQEKVRAYQMIQSTTQPSSTISLKES